MKSELYNQLVHMYAAGELTEELEETLKMDAFGNAELSQEMSTMRTTMDALRAMPDPEFTEESYQRILMKLYFRGADVQPRSPEPAHLQYHLPIQT